MFCVTATDEAAVKEAVAYVKKHGIAKVVSVLKDDKCVYVVKK